MQNLPTGTVTLLFADIAGSTRLLQSLGERYGDVLVEAVSAAVTAQRALAAHA